MNGGATVIRAFCKYLLRLFVSLLVAGVAVFPFEESPEPGSLPRLVWVIVFFSVFTLLFLWDTGYSRS
jgi:hypothetical protein